MAVRAADDALGDLFEDNLSGHSVVDQPCDVRSLGLRVKMVELEAPDVVLAAVDTPVRLEILHQLLPELPSAVVVVAPDVGNVSGTVLLVPGAVAAAAPILKTVLGRLSLVEVAGGS